MALSSFIKGLALRTHGETARKIAVARYDKAHDFNSEFASCVERFAPESIRNDPSAVAALRKQVRSDLERHMVIPYEYFLYGFADLTEEEKHEYVGDIERTFLCARLYTNNPDGWLFMDKMATYEKFSDAFGRRVMLVKDRGDEEAFRAFTRELPAVMVKPNRASGGRGVKKMDTDTEAGIADALSYAVDAGPCVVEELIDQDPRMAALHPESVNTLRYATFLDGGQVTTMICDLKIGRGSSCIDNGASGGYFAAVDKATGRVFSGGRTEDGSECIVHPDSGITIQGFQIPEWEALGALAASLHRRVPGQKYIGWDFALSKNGWVLVEGNSGGQFVGYQISQRRGIRPIVEQTLGSL